MSDLSVTVVNKTETTLSVWLNPEPAVRGGTFAKLAPGAATKFAVDGPGEWTVSYCNAGPMVPQLPQADQVMFVPYVVANSVVTIYTEVAMRVPQGDES